MYYYTYLVIPTNEKSSMFGKVYFGCHKTKNLNDKYIASGKKIRDYLKKYPNDYYREIIKFYSSEEELNKAEYDLIHPHLNNTYCLNLTEGGGVRAFPGKLNPMYSKSRTDEEKLNISNGRKGKCKGIPTWNKRKHLTEIHRQHLSESAPKSKSKEHRNNISKSLLGKKHTQEHIEHNKLSHLGQKPHNKGKKLILCEDGKKHYI